MTKGQIVEDLKAMMGPGNALTDSQLLVWVNDAYMMICDEIAKANPDFFTQQSTTHSVNGTREYELPTDFEKIIKVEVTYDGNTYRAMPLDNIGEILETTSGNANGFSSSSPHYYVIKGKLGLQPVPTETGTDNIAVWYQYTPEEMVEDSDVPEFPAKYHHLIKLGAYANYLDYDEEHASAENLRRRFDKRMYDMVENLAEYQVDKPQSVVVETNQDMYYDDTI